MADLKLTELGTISLPVVSGDLIYIVRDLGGGNYQSFAVTVGNLPAGTPADGSITLAKMADLATDKIIGRATGSTGVPEAITCTAAGRALLDDADATAQRTTLGLGTAAVVALDTDVALGADSDTRVASQKAIKAYVDGLVAGLLELKGTIDASANPNYPAALKGDAYFVSVAGKVGGASGKTVEVGDLVFALADNAGGNEATVGTSWAVLQNNVTGITAAGLTLLQAADAAAQRTALSLVIGTNVQAFSSILAAFVALSPSADDFLQYKSGAWANRTIAQVLTDIQGDGLTAAAAGFRGIPQESKSADYTLVAADAGKHVYHPSADTTPRTWTIPANGSVAFPVGTTITFVNDSSAGSITIAITTDTLVLAGAGTTGSRTLAANGIATAIKMTSTRWQINGTGLT